MAIVPVDLGAPPGGVGGDSNRTAFGKVNENFALVNIERVSGDAGFVNVSGSVTLDLANGRNFQHEMDGNITSLAFANVPMNTEFAASWSWALRIDATGGYTLSGTPTVTWVDGSTFADLDLSANAVNIVTFWQVGSITYAAFAWNGSLELDPYTMTFQEDGSVLIVVTQAETIDLGSVTHVEADGTAGTGTLSYAKNGSAASGSTAFAAGDVLTVTLASSTTPSAVSIPRSV